VQVIGDEALYGRGYIVEPSYSRAETSNPAIQDKTVVVRDYNYSNTVVYVDSWPLVAYLFSPVFSVYISPWHWGFTLDIMFHGRPSDTIITGYSLSLLQKSVL
jgi:hypothetical protein